MLKNKINQSAYGQSGLGQTRKVGMWWVLKDSKIMCVCVNIAMKFFGCAFERNIAFTRV